MAEGTAEGNEPLDPPGRSSANSSRSILGRGDATPPSTSARAGCATTPPTTCSMRSSGSPTRASVRCSGRSPRTRTCSRTPPTIRGRAAPSSGWCRCSRHRCSTARSCRAAGCSPNREREETAVRFRARSKGHSRRVADIDLRLHLPLICGEQSTVAGHPTDREQFPTASRHQNLAKRCGFSACFGQ